MACTRDRWMPVMFQPCWTGRSAIRLSWGMAALITLEEPLSPRRAHQKVLVTGAAGRIGSAFAAAAADRYELTLTDRPGTDMSALMQYGDVAQADLRDLRAVSELCQGIDTVIHLAGEASPKADWPDLLPANVIGCYNAFTAATRAGCQRLVFASSVHAVSGYSPERQVSPSDTVNPANLYGVTKCFGEALGRYMAEQRGISVIVLRIGAFRPAATREAESSWMADLYIAPDDLCQLLCLAIDVSGIRFAIFHALSDNITKRLDITDTRTLLGYTPMYGSPSSLQKPPSDRPGEP